MRACSRERFRPPRKKPRASGTRSAFRRSRTSSRFLLILFVVTLPGSPIPSSPEIQALKNIVWTAAPGPGRWRWRRRRSHAGAAAKGGAAGQEQDHGARREATEAGGAGAAQAGAGAADEHPGAADRAGCGGTAGSRDQRHQPRFGARCRHRRRRRHRHRHGQRFRPGFRPRPRHRRRLRWRRVSAGQRRHAPASDSRGQAELHRPMRCAPRSRASSSSKPW